MAKVFNEWLADFCVNGVEPAPIVKDYLMWYHGNLGKKFLMPIAPGYISNNDVYERCMHELSNLSCEKYKSSEFKVMTDVMSHTIKSSIIETDELNGVCEDGDVNQVRFIRHMTKEQIQRSPDKVDHPKLIKKKSGAFLKELIDDVCPELPESVKNWLCELFKAKTYAKRAYKDYELHITKEFWRIYDPNWLSGDFGSCMAKDSWYGNWTFYYNSVDAHAAYITKKGSRKIVARCIVFDEVRDDNSGLTYRYAERQYSSGGKADLKNILIDMLKAAGAIDINKVVGAACQERNRIVNSFTGESLSNRKFSIRCSLINDDNLSYQDSFGKYSPREHRAYNYDKTGAKVGLCTTAAWYYNEGAAGSVPSSFTSDGFHRCYIRSGSCESVNVHYYNTCGDEKTASAYTCFDDIINVRGTMWYKHDVMYDDMTNEYYPVKMMKYSKVEGKMIPECCSVVIPNGDVCYKRNAIQKGTDWYHTSSVIYVPCIKSYEVKELCTYIDGQPYPGTSEDVRKVGKHIKVMTMQGTWRNIENTEWDGDGWYDKKAYVDAVCPVWDKSSKKHVLGTKSVRPEYAFKHKGVWYDNSTCHYDLFAKEVRVKMPHKAFRYTDIHGDGEREMFVCVSDEKWGEYEEICNLILAK